MEHKPDVHSASTLVGGAPAQAAGRVAGGRTLVLVGLMGAGKTTIGRRLARSLGLPFRDADEEIEKAAGLSVADIFALHGEADFRRGERAVIGRLLSEEPQHVLATGGGAFIDPEIRAQVRARGLSIWLKADLELLVSRVSGRRTRPLLLGVDARAKLQSLIDERHPIYALADVTIDSVDAPHGVVLAAIRARLADFS